MRQEPSNARFWVYWHDGSWVKLTLKPGQRIELHTGGQTDEGWSYTAYVYEHMGDRISREEHTASMDCDGRLDRHYADECSLSELKSEPIGEYRWDEVQGNVFVPDPSGIRRPAWEKVRSSQRDYAAEAAGY